MSQIDLNKPNRFAAVYCFWIISDRELIEQTVNYHTLSVGKSARKLSSMLLVSIAIINTISVVNRGDYVSLADVALALFFATFIYRGYRWAAVGAMIFWTLAKLSMSYEKGGAAIVMQVIWWCLLMKPFYLAYVIGRNPKLPTSEPNETARDHRETA